MTVSTTPFTGFASESFEQFVNSPNPVGSAGGSISIFNGLGTLTTSGGNGEYFSYRTGAVIDLVDNGIAQIADGNVAIYNSDPADNTFTFAAPQTRFGGYFNARSTSNQSDTLVFTFRDASNNVIAAPAIDVASNASGVLNFFGFSSTIAFSSLTIQGTGFGTNVAMDNLQLGTAASVVPEAGSGLLALASLPAAMLVIARRRMGKK